MSQELNYRTTQMKQAWLEKHVSSILGKLKRSLKYTLNPQDIAYMELYLKECPKGRLWRKVDEHLNR